MICDNPVFNRSGVIYVSARQGTPKSKPERKMARLRKREDKVLSPFFWFVKLINSKKQY